MNTRKKTIYNFLKTGIFLFGITLLLWNCEKEADFTENNISTSLKKYTLNRVQKTEYNSNLKLKEKLTSIQEGIKTSKKNLLARYDNVHFTLNLDQATHIVSTEENYHSYTFGIYNEDDSYDITNIVLSSHNNQEYKAYLVTYALTKDERKIIDEGAYFDYTEKVSVASFDMSQITYNRGCYKYIQTGEEDCSCHDTHAAGGCTHPDPVYEWVEAPEGSCGGTSSTSGSENNNGSDSSGGGTSATGTGNPTQNNNNVVIVSTPVKNPLEKTALTEVLNCVNNLSPDLGMWLSGQAEIPFNTTCSSIQNYINNNGCNDDTKSFIELGLQAEINGGEVDYDEKIILDSTFVSNPRLKCVYDKFKNGTNTISNYLENFLGEKPVAHLEFKTDNNFTANNPDYASASAITSEPVNYLINITFNTDSSNSDASESHMPTIILALEFIHEMVHAEMFRKLLSYAQEPNIPWTTFFIKSIKNDFGGLSDYYTRFWLELPPNQEPDQMQHQAMAQHYCTMIVDALKDFDNNQHADSFYEALAWTGLKGTGTIDPLTGLPENATEAWKGLTNSERNNINIIISNTIQNETHDCN